ncbi:PKD domain-containing protein [bacterium]|nr:PKD domain-containing protein [bacterium]
MSKVCLPLIMLGLLLSGLCLLLAQAGCAGSGSSGYGSAAGPGRSGIPSQPAPSSPRVAQPPVALPTAEQLQILAGMPQRAGSYLPQDLELNGSNCLTSPSANISVSANGLVFDPATPQNGLKGMAFALYQFSVPDYAGLPELHFEWSAVSGSLSDASIMVLNVQTGRWEAYGLDLSLKVTLPQLAAYFDANGILSCAVVIGADAPAELSRIRLGSQPPVVVVSSAPLLAFPPQHFDFDASASSDPDGSIVEYLWDPEGDGSFVSSGADPHFGYDYEFIFNNAPRIRVLDDSGTYSEAQIEMRLTGSRIMSFGNLDRDFEARSVLTDSASGKVYVAGSSTQTELDARFSFIDPLEQDGVSCSWGGAGDDILEDIALGAGGVVAVGSTRSFGDDQQALLQFWSSGGFLTSSFRLSQSDVLSEFRSVVVTNDSIYAAGLFFDQGVGRPFALLVAFNLLGEIQWARSIIAPGNCFLNELRLRPQTPLGPPMLLAGGVYQPSAGENQAFFARYDLSGNLLEALSWGDTGRPEEATDIALAGTSVLPVAYVSGMAGSQRCFVSIPGGAAKSFSVNPSSLSCAGLLRRDNSSVNLLINASNAGGGELLQLVIDSGLETVNFVGTSFSGDDSFSFNDAQPWASGLVAVGRMLGELPQQQDSFSFGSHTESALWTSESPSQGTLSGLSAVETEHEMNIIIVTNFNLDAGANFQNLLLLLPPE